jgi:dTMP kinase
MSRGRFIVLEGLDGAGTTTQCTALAAILRTAGHEVHVTREPSDRPIGKLIRKALTGRLGLPSGKPLTPQTLALLFAADRVDHLAAEVEPALKRGAVVLSDRYVLSSLAYQGAQLGQAWVAQVNRHARTPDLTILLQVPPAVAGRRRTARGSARELYETKAVQARTARAYQQALKRLRRRGERIVVLDGSAPVDEVTHEALAHIHALGLR